MNTQQSAKLFCEYAVQGTPYSYSYRIREHIGKMFTIRERVYSDKHKVRWSKSEYIIIIIIIITVI